jgi:hypothetical protein
MRCTVRALIAVLLAIAWPTQATADPASHGPIVVRVAQLLDVKAGAYLKDAAVLVEDERIKAVGRANGTAGTPKSSKR